MEYVYIVRCKLATLRSTDTISNSRIAKTIEQLRQKHPSINDAVGTIHRTEEGAIRTMHGCEEYLRIRKWEVKNQPGTKTDYYCEVRQFYIDQQPLYND